jgi:hypothetical protein
LLLLLLLLLPMPLHPPPRRTSVRSLSGHLGLTDPSLARERFAASRAPSLQAATRSRWRAALFSA